MTAAALRDTRLGAEAIRCREARGWSAGASHSFPRPGVQYTTAQMAAELSNRIAATTATPKALAWIRGEALTA